MGGGTTVRVSKGVRQLLAARAERDGLSVTALLEQLAVEGVKQRDHPGIIFRGPSDARRAALAAGPDVWKSSGGSRSPTTARRSTSRY